MADGTQHPNQRTAMPDALTGLIEATAADLFERLDEIDQDGLTRAMQAAYELGRDRAPYRFDLTTGGRETIGDKTFLLDAKGRLVPEETVKPTDLLMDELVRRMMGHALGVSGAISRFKQHSLNDVSDLLALLDQNYSVKLGGTKGNVSLTSFDGTLKVTLQVADRLTFGPELQAAKKLVDEYLNEATAEGAADLRVMVQQAFSTDQEGKVNRAELFGLLRREFTDERLVRAMEAVRESVRVEGTKEYIRFHRRETPTSAWEAVTIDLAAA